jgi:hypothetical protein
MNSNRIPYTTRSRCRAVGNGLGLAGELHHIPIEMRPVRVEQAQGALVFVVADRGQKRLEIRVGVARMNLDIGAASAQRFEMRGLIS